MMETVSPAFTVTGEAVAIWKGASVEQESVRVLFPKLRTVNERSTGAPFWLTQPKSRRSGVIASKSAVSIENNPDSASDTTQFKPAVRMLNRPELAEAVAEG